MSDRAGDDGGAFTPGPWHCCRLNGRWAIYPCSAINDGIDYFIARTIKVDGIGNEKPNACLMAAAPELLAACEAVENAMPGAFECVRAAIAKAVPARKSGAVPDEASAIARDERGER